ncbi:MAG: putative major pilin subunit [Verrucomicrobiales bacterium]|nr:putative major pilin subunit [Verrucomicrobiales bacterium]
MYAADNQGVLVLNPDGPDGGTFRKPSWAGGWLDFTGWDSTNILGLKRGFDDYPSRQFSGLLGTYLTDASVYKCPEDKSTATISGKKLPRVRSVSMNAYMGGIQIHNSNLLNTWVSTRFEVYSRKSSFLNVSPSQLFVFIEEKAESINDGCFNMDMVSAIDPSRQLTPGKFRIVDYPAGYHENGAALSFADGHAELWQWKDPRTILSVKPNETMVINNSSADNADIGRLAVATSRPK